MKRVRDRRLYDTEQADQIAEYAPITDRGDFNYLIERLYRTPEGEYFLHGKGGASTKYRKRISGGHTDGEELRLLTEEEALDWCEHRSIDGDIVVKEFGHLID